MKNPSDLTNDTLANLVYAMLQSGREPVDYKGEALKAEFRRRFEGMLDRHDRLKRKGGK